MARVSITPLVSIRRTFSAAAATEIVRMAVAPAFRKTAAEPSPHLSAAGRSEGEVYWMRDPKTGNWIPENHFGTVDVAEQREQLLSKK